MKKKSISYIDLLSLILIIKELKQKYDLTLRREAYEIGEILKVQGYKIEQTTKIPCPPKLNKSSL